MAANISQFLEENSGSTFYHATTTDRFEVIYCPDKEKGIWFIPKEGVGPLQARALGILKGIAWKAINSPSVVALGNHGPGERPA